MVRHPLPSPAADCRPAGRRPLSAVLLLAVGLVAASACEPGPAPDDSEPPAAAPTRQAPPDGDATGPTAAKAEAPPAPVAPPAPQAEAGPPVDAPPPLRSGAPARIAARHLLVSWAGATGASGGITRSRAEALDEIRRLQDQLTAGADLATLARQHSDDPSRGRGGDLGAFGRGAMVKPFENAAFALKIGELSDVVETEFGFHLIQRYHLTEAHLGHVLVQWEGLPRASTTRTREEARAIAEQARARLLAGEPLSEVAPALSDGPSAARGGDLGIFQKGQMMDSFDEVAFELSVGEVSEITETAAGFHVIQRLR